MKKTVFIARAFEVPNQRPLGCDEHKIMICRVKSGLKAFQLNCPHKGVKLSSGLILLGDKLACPAHKFLYDLNTGENTMTVGGLPRTPPLKEFKLIQEEEKLFVELDEESDK